MMTKQPKPVKLRMMNDAVRLSGIHTGVTPEQYVREIANNTEMGQFYKTMVDRFGEDVTTLAYDMTSFRAQTEASDGLYNLGKIGL